MAKREVVLCAPVRTAIGAYNGSLKATPATELGATVVRETLGRANLDPAKLSAVVMGNVVQAGNKMNPACQAAIQGGAPVDAPAMTVNRVCGSGAQAIASAAQEVWLSFAEAVIAGGMENMDAAPYLMSSGHWGYRMGDAQIYDSMLRDGLNDAFSGEHSGSHTEDFVTKYQISREDQDCWAAHSSYGLGAVEPGMFGIGPVPAVRQALERAEWALSDVDRGEINEAFAAIALAVTRELGLAEDIVNVEGGAIAHGHPIGATGAILTTRLLHSMQRDGLRRGIVTLCIGGGQGIALALEMLP